MPINTLLRAGIVLGILASPAAAQTAGTVQLQATIHDYTGSSGDNHYTAVWVTTESGTFIRTLWEQGPSLGDSEWRDHCRTFWDAKSGENTVDGFSGATAKDYTATANNPIDPEWDCINKSGTLVPDGNYKLWIQYAESSGGEGPYTTNGLLWTKGSAGATTNYSNQGSNFTNMSVTWEPAVVLVAPKITSSPPPATGIVGVPYTPYLCTASGTTPITFTATGLPPGLTISAPGMIFGTPTEAGTFSGTITASNGTAPNATQAFSITISELLITSVESSGSNLIMSGTGPANGTYTILSSPDPSQALNLWSIAKTGTFDGSGQFAAASIPVATGVTELYYRLQVP